MTITSTKKKVKSRERSRLHFMIRGVIVCEKTFLFCHAIGGFCFKRLSNILRTEGLVEKKHGNANRSPANVTKYVDYKAVSTFLINYGEQNGLLLPGRVANCHDWNAILLPASDTKENIYRKYVASCEVSNSHYVSLYVFSKIWRECHPRLRVQKGMSDLCGMCQQNFTSLSQFALRTEEEKMKVINSSREHLLLAQTS